MKVTTLLTLGEIRLSINNHNLKGSKTLNGSNF